MKQEHSKAMRWIGNFVEIHGSELISLTGLIVKGVIVYKVCEMGITHGCIGLNQIGELGKTFALNAPSPQVFDGSCTVPMVK